MNMIEEFKMCNFCNENKPISEYMKNRGSKCRTCFNIHRRYTKTEEYILEKKEREKEEENLESKICNYCNENKKSIYFYNSNPNKCKICCSKYKKYREEYIKTEEYFLKEKEKENLEFRICNLCNENKVISDYNKNRQKYMLRCKNCCNKLHKEYRNNIVKSEEQISKRKEYSKKYREENKEKVKDNIKKCYIKNEDKYKNSRRKWINENKEIINEKKRERRKTDPRYALYCTISDSIRKSLKVRRLKKNNRAVDVLGCDMDFFKNYIEERFEDWMTWDNRGLYNGELNYGWDIDHIIPMATAKTLEEIIELNHYTNLQPLCSKINRDIKRDLIDY